MKWIALTALLALGAATACPPAEAGCLTGAVVGGVAGHMVGHGVAGAAVGCAVGHHEKVKAEREQQAQQEHDAGKPDSSQRVPE